MTLASSPAAKYKRSESAAPAYEGRLLKMQRPCTHLACLHTTSQASGANKGAADAAHHRGIVQPSWKSYPWPAWTTKPTSIQGLPLEVTLHALACLPAQEGLSRLDQAGAERPNTEQRRTTLAPQLSLLCNKSSQQDVHNQWERMPQEAGCDDTHILPCTLSGALKQAVQD